MNSNLLEVSGLHVSAGDKEILHGVDLTVGKDETHVLMGPNGTGKSTLGYAITGNPEYTVTAGKIVFDGIIDCAKACVAQGIPVGLGTDTGCPYVTHYGMWRELVYFSKFCGVSNAFALYTATCRNAEIAGLGDQLGTVEPGKLADLIVTEGNPLEDLQTLRNVSMVVTGGKIIDHPKVKKMPQVEQELDKFL